MKESYEFVEEKDEAVRNLIAGLPRVEAPGDFDMRVRARIAAGRPAGTSWLTPLVRVAVPAALLLAIGGYFGYNALYQNGPAPISDVVSIPEPKPEQPPVEPPQPITTSTNDLTPDSPASRQREENVGRNSQRAPQSPNRRAGSTDIYNYSDARRVAKRILPRGFSLDTQPLQNVNASDSSANISPKDIFEAIGVTASYTSAAWKVGSVRPNSMADKSGVKPGDLIEAVNDQLLNEKTDFGRSFTGTSLRVRRDGRPIKLNLKP